MDLSTDIIHSADVAVLVMEDGLAHLCLIKGHMSIIISKIEKNIAKKRTGSNKRDKNLNSF